MKEYPIFSPKTGKSETKPLDQCHVYDLPYTEQSYRIGLGSDGSNKTIVGSNYIKTRLIVEGSLPKIRFFRTKKRIGKRAQEIAENHSIVERIMNVQEVMLKIHTQIIEAMRQVYKQDEGPVVQIKKLRIRIGRLDIPGILKTNGMDVSTAQGSTRFGHAGFLLGFNGTAIYGLRMVTDEKGDFFLDNHIGGDAGNRTRVQR